MKLVAVLIVITLLLAGCKVNPRYRTGGKVVGEEQSPKSDDDYAKSPGYSPTTKASTLDFERLGRIIQSYLGTPYAGSSPFEKGLDCSEFTRFVYDEFDRTRLPRTAREQFTAGRKVEKQKLQYGDLVFFKTNGNKISHVGLYTGFGEFAHSSSSEGVVISKLNDSYWKKRFVGARRILP